MRAMAKLRIIGPREQLLSRALPALQDTGILHPVPCALDAQGLSPAGLPPQLQRTGRHLRRMADDLDRALSLLPLTPSSMPAAPPDLAELPHLARVARRARKAAEALAGRAASLQEERALIEKYKAFFSAVRSIVPDGPEPRRAYCLVLRRATPTPERLAAALREAIHDDFELRTRTLPDGELAAVLLVPGSAAPVVERALAAARVEEVPLPGAYAGEPLSDALPRMLARAEALPVEISAVQAELSQMAARDGDALARAQRAVHDLLAQLTALSLARTTRSAFVLDGWVPEGAQQQIQSALAQALDASVDVEELAREQWTDPSAPVVLQNRAPFRPFEELVRFMSLPRYGTIDPTPWVALSFPLFFGLMLGDVGYGALLLALALLLRRRARTDRMRSIGSIAIACATSSMLFGVLFGELFGDLGERLLHLRPLLFSREQALLPLLILSVALGGAHVVFGLVLGVFGARRSEPREALGRAIRALIVLLAAAVVLALFGVLPRALALPGALAAAAALIALVAAQGLLGPIELFSALGNVFSYARLMALGLASVMMALVANRIAGAIGSAIAGVLLAVVFHAINLALGLLGPTIHALRLHYVEFFGKFYSAGGAEYRPLRRFQPAPR